MNLGKLVAKIDSDVLACGSIGREDEITAYGRGLLPVE
jgi:hypothetical protein